MNTINPISRTRHSSREYIKEKQISKKEDKKADNYGITEQVPVR